MRHICACFNVSARIMYRRFRQNGVSGGKRDDSGGHGDDDIVNIAQRSVTRIAQQRAQ